jgi:hypothetical protein
MNRRLLGILSCLLVLSGCGGGTTPPDPEAPVRDLVAIAQEYAAILDDLSKKADSTAIAEANEALTTAETKLKALKLRMEEVGEKAKNMSETERNGFQKEEYSKKLQQAQAALRKSLPKIVEMLERKDLDAKKKGNFKQMWYEVQTSARALDEKLNPPPKQGK